MSRRNSFFHHCRSLPDEHGSPPQCVRYLTATDDNMSRTQESNFSSTDNIELSDEMACEVEYTLDEFDKNLLADSHQEGGYNVTQLPQPMNSYGASTFSSPMISTLHNRRRQTKRPGRDISAEPTTIRPEIIRRSSSCEASEREQQPMVTRRYVSNLPPTVRGIQLIPISYLPDQLKTVFKYPLLNAVQSRCFAHVYESDNNLVVSAPTGSGKTAIMELAICRLLSVLKNGQFKIVYQAPTKALCSERFRDWSTKFSVLDLHCAELTGDTEFNSLKNVANSSIIITTPEKWDSVTRKWKDNARLMEMVKLFMIDEVHILKDARGATLEAVVSRMKSVGNGVRFVALSATIPNPDDIAAWLTLNSSQPQLPAHKEVFDESFRPVKLEKHVISYGGSSNPWAFEASLTKELPSIISRYSKGKPVMIFCSTQKTAIQTAKALANSVCSPWNGPRKVIQVSDEVLKQIVPMGVAFHHGGLDGLDKRVVENAFLKGDIHVICSTSTLAVGVNLPCYLVILKGTNGYTDNGLQNYPNLETMQMLGRAGRPQFETSACAVIMTHRDNQVRYEKILMDEDILESSLHRNLIEHLNAEIGIGTIRDFPSATQWLAGTFLNVRLCKNPAYYQLEGSIGTTAENQILQQLCEHNIQLLRETKLIHSGDHLRCTEFGDAMARYYVKYATMKKFTSLPRSAKVSEILKSLSHAEEFLDLRLKAGEKSFYKDINKMNDIRFPIEVDIALPAHKVSLLIQAKLGCSTLEKNDKYKQHHRQFIQDTYTVLGHCTRLIRCIIDMQLKLDDSVATKNALELGRSLAAGVWDNTPMQLKQIPNIGDVYVRKLAAAGIRSIEELYHMEPPRIELLLGKQPPFGTNILKSIAGFPLLHISAREIGKSQKHENGVKVQISCEIGFVNRSPALHFNKKHYYVLFLCDTSEGRIVDFRRFGTKRIQTGEDIKLTALLTQPTTHLNFHVMCDDLAGTHRYAELRLNIPASWYRPQISLPQSLESVHDLTDCGMSQTLLVQEGFGDDDLDDGDLLAAENTAEETEIVVADIDEILTKQGRMDQQVKEHKRKRSSGETKCDGDSISVEFREPHRLLNGRWSCQHDCEDKGRQCSHKCCMEGVAKPRKRPRRVLENTHHAPLPQFQQVTAAEKSWTEDDYEDTEKFGDWCGRTSNGSQQSVEPGRESLYDTRALLLVPSQSTQPTAKVVQGGGKGQTLKEDGIKNRLDLPFSDDMDFSSDQNIDPTVCDWAPQNRSSLVPDDSIYNNSICGQLSIEQDEILHSMNHINPGRNGQFVKMSDLHKSSENGEHDTRIRKSSVQPSLKDLQSHRQLSNHEKQFFHSSGNCDGTNWYNTTDMSDLNEYVSDTTISPQIRGIEMEGKLLKPPELNVDLVASKTATPSTTKEAITMIAIDKPQEETEQHMTMSKEEKDDQKWEGIEPWFREMYGSVVELI